MARNFKASDEGKTVVNADGDEIGTIEEVRGNNAYVKPKSGLAQKIRDRLGWSDDDDAPFELRQSKVDTITNDEVRLVD